MNVLVIDDQIWRRRFYSKLEKQTFEFRIDFLDEEGVHSLNREALNSVDLVLLDLILDGEWNVNSEGVARIIRSINKELPIVLITGNWSALNNGQIQSITDNYDTEAVPLPFTDLLSLEEFEALSGHQIDKRDAKGISENNISYLGRTLVNIYNKRNGQKYLGKNKDESIFILHLSDMQLGGEHEKSSLLDPATIAHKVKNQHGAPDFIAVTGDIAETGLVSEFEQAMQWFSDLCECLEWSPPYERILLTPGNHDIYSSAFGTCKYQYVRGAHNESGSLQHIEDTQLSVPNLSSYSLFNFNKFAFQLTGQSYWLDGGESYWKDSRFVSLGANFMGLNTVCNVDFNSPFKGFPSANDYREIRKALNGTETKSNILNIALFHHPELKDDMCFKTFCEVEPSPDVLLAGHEHQPRFDHLRDLEQLLFIAPTSSLRAELRWPDVTRGFSVIELQRKEGVVYGIKEYSYCRIKNRWVDFSKKPEFRFCPDKKNKWREIFDD
ncbi:metallophosphoesterase [Pseudoalteromonas sp. XMcav11-Q]|uniref:metallophosphoesterase family protein n=1 Tax=Pseudoalteromonas sp. XMcav11-Q TaxID=3136665 RepID=UPI0032C47B3C